MAIKNSLDVNGNIKQTSSSDVLTQAQVDAQALYSAAKAINPYQATLIKKNAQGNIMSPGVLESLSALGVDAKSGVAKNIADIDALTREKRLADQKAEAQAKSTADFEKTNNGKVWTKLKGLTRTATTFLGGIYEGGLATLRTGVGEAVGAAKSFALSSVGAEGFTPQAEVPSAFEQTKSGQVILKSIKDVRSGKMPSIDLGSGFFPSEEVGQGKAARDKSLDAAKVAVRNSKGKVIGYQPTNVLAFSVANIVTLGHPENRLGTAAYLASDITASFMFDPGISRAKDIAQLKKLESQLRTKNALDAAVKVSDNIKKLQAVQDETINAAEAAKKASDELKGININNAKQDIVNNRNAWKGANEEAIKSSKSVQIAQRRLDDTTAFVEAQKARVEQTRKAISDLTAAVKAPTTIAKTEKSLAKQTAQLAKVESEIAAAKKAGRIPMFMPEDVTVFKDKIAALQSKLDAARLVTTAAKDVDPQELARLQNELSAAVNNVKDGTNALKAGRAQVAERMKTARITARAQEIAAQETLKATKAEKTLTELVADKTLSLKDKRTAQRLWIERLNNLDSTLQRPANAYQDIANFLTGGHGTIAVDRLVAMTDWKAIWRKSGGRIDHQVAKALADAKTPDDVVDALAPSLLRSDIQQGVLKPGLLSRTGERISARTQFALAPLKVLTGQGARVQQRLSQHKRVAALFEGFYDGFKGQKELIGKPLKRGYATKIKSGFIVNIADREELLRATEDFAIAANLPQNIIDDLIEKIGSAASNAVAGKTASIDLLDAVFAHHAEKIPKHLQDQFKDYTTAFKSSAEEMSSYWATRHAQGAELKYMTLKGESITLPGPHMQSELLNSTVYFPPVGEFLKLTSKLGKYRGLSKSTEIGDALIGNFWKKAQLVRPAYIIRNIAEEQIRVFGTGHISIFNNPGMALAMWLGRQESDSAVRKILGQFDTYRHTLFNQDFSTGDDITDVLNETIGSGVKNSFVEMMKSDKLGSFDERGVRVLQFKNVGAVPYGHKRFFDGVANALRMLNSDEMAAVVAGKTPAQVDKLIKGGMTREDAVVQYFLTGNGRKTLDAFAESTPDNFSAFIKTPEGLKKYLYDAKDAETGADISMLARVTEASGGNASLKELIATGKINIGGKVYKIPTASDEAINSVSNAKQMKTGKKALLAAQEQFAKELKDAFNKNGNWQGVSFNVPSRNLAYVESKKDKFQFVDWFFEKATEFEKNSTFGPEFRQAYWDAIFQVSKSLDANAVKALEKVAQNSLNPLQKAGVNVGTKHPVWNAFRSATGNGPLSLEDAHAYADTYARNKVKGLFYNAQEKRLIFHQLRLIAPFANAWEDTIKRWGEIAIENPEHVYKGVKALDWLTSPESSAIYQLTDARDIADPNSGFFFNDPKTNQRQFFVPFAGTVLSKLAGIATGTNYSGSAQVFTANPASFNFALGAGSILPGVGPGVTIPISALSTFNQSFFDNMSPGIKNWLFPFGPSDFSAGPLSAVLPANWNKILGGTLGIEQTYASNYKPVLGYLAAGGSYNLDNPEDQARLAQDADIFARFNSIMRGIVGLFSPTSLIQNGLAKDKNGDATTQFALFEDFQTILNNNDGDYNKAWFDFFDLYGVAGSYAIISSTSGSGPSNSDSYDFVVSNPDVASKYTDVWGYVMPGGGLSQEMYKWNIVNDTKKKLTTKEIVQKVNNQRFYAARDSLMTKVDAGLMDKDQYSTALNYLKDSMGGGPVVEFDPNKRARILTQLTDLVEDPRFTDLPSVTGLRDYLYLRQTALDKLQKKKFTGAKNEQGVRDWLSAQAVWVVQDNPEFQKMFYAFFANELEGK